MEDTKISSFSVGLIKGFMIGLEYDEDPDGAYELGICLDLGFIRISYIKGIDLGLIDS